MRKVLIGGKILTPDRVLRDQALVIEGEKIAEITPRNTLQLRPQDWVRDLSGKWLSPGFLDNHVHGGGGADVMDATRESWDGLSRYLVSTGVTAYLPTIGAASQQEIGALIDFFSGYTTPDDGAVPLGVHLEGPYLNPKKKGVQLKKHLRDPEPEEYQAWLESGVVKLITIAPELPGALTLIQEGRRRGVAFAVGHSSASYGEMLEAVEAGVNQASHIFNAMEPLHHRQPGVLGVVLSDPRLYAQVIADGVHVHPAVVKILTLIKGINRTTLVTDAMQAAGLADGGYQLFGQVVQVSNGEVRVSSGELAGSVLSMDQGLRNLMEFSGLSLNEAVVAASTAPAASLNLVPIRGVLQPGARADLAVLTEGLDVDSTYIGGRLVYQRRQS